MMRLLVRVGASLTVTTLILIAAALGIGALTPGRIIAYSAEEGERFAYIFIYDMNNGIIHKVNKINYNNERNPIWSPDGNRILVSTLDPFGNTNGGIIQLLPYETFYYNLDDRISGAVPIGWAANGIDIITYEHGYDWRNTLMTIGLTDVNNGMVTTDVAVFHPITLIRYWMIPNSNVFIGSTQQGELVRWAIFPSSLSPTFMHSILPPIIDPYSVQAVGSSDAKWIAYTFRSGTSYDIHMVENSYGLSENSDRTILVTQRSTILNLSFSSDTKTIAFAEDSDGDFELYSVPTDGSGIVAQLTNNDCLDEAPEFSPDGTQVVYVSDCDNPYGYTDVWIMDADGSNQRPLTRGRGRHFTPRWRPQPGY